MYSPPPLDGFSPPPMSDFSPPPLSDLSPLRDFPPPINGFSSGGDETEEDGEYGFGLEDDLTGLSDKINRLELEKMKSLPPREILELKRESSGLPPCDESENIDTAGEDLPNQATLTSQDEEENISVEDVLEDNINGNVSDQEAICDKNPASEETYCDNAVIESQEEQLTTEVEENVIGENKDTEESEDEFPVAGEASKPEDTIKTEADWECEAPEDDTCWGEFPEDDTGNAGESWSDFPPAPPDEWSLPAETRSGERADLEFDDSEDDDDFGDFGEASEQVQTSPASVESSLYLELKQLIEKSSSILESVYNLPGGEADWAVDVGKTSLAEAVLREGEIFEKIEDPASAPALEHEWRNSATYNTLLTTLGIDSSSNVSPLE